jgi:hypothetical protein
VTAVAAAGVTVARPAAASAGIRADRRIISRCFAAVPARARPSCLHR